MSHPDPKHADEQERQLKQLSTELSSKFSRLVKSLRMPRDAKYPAPWVSGSKQLPVTSPNGRGTERFNLEVDFAYLQDEFDHGPTYLRPKLIDRMSGIISTVITRLKEQKEQPETEGA